MKKGEKERKCTGERRKRETDSVQARDERERQIVCRRDEKGRENVPVRDERERIAGESESDKTHFWLYAG